jgi:hypothetical protein
MYSKSVSPKTRPKQTPWLFASELYWLIDRRKPAK